MRLLVVLAVLAPAAARAEPAAETRERQLRDPAVEYDLLPLRRVSWRLDAIAAQTTDLGDGTVLGGLATVGGEVAVANDVCDVVVAGGQLGVASADDGTLSAEQWLSTCPVGGDRRITYGHLLQWDTRPALLAAPQLRPRGNRRYTSTVRITTGSKRLNDQGPLVLAPSAPEYLLIGGAEMGSAIDWADGRVAASGFSVDFEFIGLRREPLDGSEPLELWFGAAGTEVAMLTDLDGRGRGQIATMTLDAIRFSGIPLGGARLGGRLGLGIESVGIKEPDARAGATAIDGEAALSLDADPGGVHVRLDAGRSHWALWDGRAVIDDRATLSISRTQGRLRLRADLFAARTHLFGLDGLTAAASGGATAVAETDLGRHATVRIRSDLGRGFYTRNATFEDPRWGAEILATLALRAGTR
jgi:hypothetical protein